MKKIIQGMLNNLPTGKIIKVHRINLGPHTKNNPHFCLSCGKYAEDWKSPNDCKYPSFLILENFCPTHPELFPGEMCIGNFKEKNIVILKVLYKTLRVGSAVLAHDGEWLRTDVAPELKPCFINAAEY